MCEDLSQPLNGYMLSENFSYASTVHYMCDTGYLLIGQNGTTCVANGTWTSSPPECTGKRIVMRDQCCNNLDNVLTIELP